MERGLDRFFKICKDLFENPKKTSVENFAEYVSQELSAGHIAHLTDCFQAVTDEIGELSETDFATLDKIFELGFHLMIPNILEAVLHDDVVCTPDAMDMLLSLFRLLNASCEKSTQGKTKLAPLVPALIHDFLLNDERGTPLRVEAVKLTNMIFEETVYDERNGLDTISLALKDLDSICREENMEHQLASAGDFELQAGLVELIFHLIPEMVRQDKAHVYFSDSSVARAFMDIKSSEFEAGCRYFLNTLNQNLKEKQSVASFPCHSATFGTAEVHPPIDPKITDFWVDFNLKSRSISLYVEERDNEGNSKDGNSLWELLLIKAEIVQDYRLTGTGKNDIVLLLKLRVSASDVVTFLQDNCSQYVKITFNDDYSPGLSAVLPKILGKPKCKNSSGESDVNSTPSKASVAINPVYIRSRNREMAAYVMPTASLMLQLSDGTTDQEEEARQDHETASQTSGRAVTPNKSSSKNTHGKDISRGKDQSEHVDKNHGNNLYDVKAKKTTTISDESVSGEDDVHEDSNKVENEGKPGKRTSRRVTSKRDMEQSKETDISEGDENARSDSFGKSYPAVFNVSERLAASKRKSVPTMSLPDASKRRKAIEKRVFSKPVCSPPVSEDVEEVSELHMVAPPRRRKPRSGLVSRNRVKDLVAVNNEDLTDIIQDSMPLADSLEDEDQSVNRKERRAGKRAVIPMTSPTKERTKKRGTVSSSPAAVRKTKRSNTLDDKCLERSRKEIKTSTSQKGTLQSLKAKYQEYEDTCNLTEPEVNNELDDVDEIVNEQVTGDDDLVDDELTDCYVDEAFPTIKSPPVALTSQSRTRRRSPVRKVRQTRHSRLDVSSWKEVSAEDSPVRKQNGNIHKGRGYRERKAQNEVHLNIGSTPDDVYHSDESDGNYDEEDVDKEPVGHEKTIVVSRARRREREDTGNTTYHADEGIDSEEEELDFKSTDLDYDFNVSITPRLIRPQPRRSKPLLASDSRQSGSLKRSLVLSDSGIGETPLGRKNQDKMNIPRRRSWQPLTPVTPRLEQDDEENSGDAESDEASVRSNGTPGQETLEIKHRKKKFVDWSTSGPSTLYDLSISGVTPSRMEGNFKNPMHVSEGARMLSYRSQQFGKPRKLLYDEEPFNVQDGEDLINDTSEEEIRNEVQGLIKIAGGEVFKSVRRKRQMIKSFLVRTTEMVLSSNDTRRNEQLEASYSAVKSNRSQLTEQIHSLERDFGKTASTIKEMENTISTFQSTVGKQFKILKGQRQIEEKRFKGVHHLHKSIEAELTKLERNRSAQEATFRAELEKETLKFKKKFLQDTRKQKEDQLKMMLNVLQIP